MPTETRRETRFTCDLCRVQGEWTRDKMESEPLAARFAGLMVNAADNSLHFEGAICRDCYRAIVAVIDERGKQDDVVRAN